MLYIFSKNSYSRFPTLTLTTDERWRGRGFHENPNPEYLTSQNLFHKNTALF